jgi:hypothetical protein
MQGAHLLSRDGSAKLSAEGSRVLRIVVVFHRTVTIVRLVVLGHQRSRFTDPGERHSQQNGRRPD